MADSQNGDGLAPGAHRMRRPVLLIVLAVVLVVVYAGVVLLYAQGSGGHPAAHPVPTSEGVHVVLTPRSVDTTSGEVMVQAEFDGSSTVVAESGLTMAEPTDLLVVSDRGKSLTSFAAGQPVAPTTVPLGTNGTVETWPFDRYTTETVVLAYQGQAAETGKDTVPLATDATLGAYHVSGWRFALTKTKTWNLQTDDGPVPVNSYAVTATRATSTIVFGLVLLALMIAMPIMGLVVAVLVLRGRRPFEPAFLSWIAAMLFATPMLRTFLPGAPPIGSWVDYLVVLWVIAGLILALVIAVVAWHRWSSPPR